MEGARGLRGFAAVEGQGEGVDLRQSADLGLGSGMDIPQYPIDWANFGLTEMMRQLSLVAMDTFCDHREKIEPLLKIDAALAAGLPEFFGKPNERTLIGIMLFGRMHVVSRSAAQLIFSGQQLEASAIMRATLECAVYGWAVSTNDEMHRAWMLRLTDPSARKSAIRVLSWSRMMNMLSDADIFLADRVKQLYEMFIDFGGHPNAQAILTGVQTIDHPEGGKVVTISQTHITAESLRDNVISLAFVLHSGFLLMLLAMPHRQNQTNFETTMGLIFEDLGIRKNSPLFADVDSRS